MNTDEQLIERLRFSMNAAVADVVPPRGLLDGISPSPVHRFRAPTLGGVAVVGASVAALVVAVVALTALKHAPPAAPRPSAPEDSRPALSADSLPALRSELAILRRPQAPADKVPGWGIAAEERPHCSNCLNLARVIPAETRLVATLRIPRAKGGPTREHVYLALGTVPKAWDAGLSSGWRQHGPATTALHLSLFGLRRSQPPTAQPQDELLNYTGRPVPADPLTPSAVLITTVATVGIVPDGVTRVKWELANPGQARAATVYPRIRGDVAIAPWTPAPRSTALINEQWLVSATWYAADGRVIDSFSQSLTHLDTGTSTP